MSDFLELYDNVFVLSFWHFSAWISYYSDKMELYLYKKKNLVCCLLMVLEHWFIYLFFFLANFVDGVNA